MFNSPNTAAMMGAVPAKRRGVAAGARTLLQNTGAILSIAFVMAVVTSSIPQDDAVRDLLRPGLEPLAREAGAVHLQHALRAVVPGGRVAARDGGVPDAAQPRLGRGRAGGPRARPPPPPPRDEHHGITARSGTRARGPRGPAEPAHRRRRPPGRHHAPHDPLLRGDRPAAAGARPGPPAATASTRRRRWSGCRR